MKTFSFQNTMRIVSLSGFAICVVLAFWGFKSGAFSSEKVMAETVAGFGMAAPALFIMIQAMQVVIPILPGGISCLAGVILFGAVNGFFYNYIGICIGSVLAFALTKSCGRPLLAKLFGDRLLDKYDGWTKDKKSFERFFALAIFLPVAPDDFLCYLAGTTAMSYRKFITIIILCKPFAILMYSLLLKVIVDLL